MRLSYDVYRFLMRVVMDRPLKNYRKVPWEIVGPLLAHHGLELRVYRHLMAGDHLGEVPRDWLNQVEQRVRHRRLASIHLTGVLKAASDALSREDVPFVLVGAAPLVLQHYSDPMDRALTAVRICIPEGHKKDALRFLESQLEFEHRGRTRDGIAEFQFHSPAQPLLPLIVQFGMAPRFPIRVRQGAVTQIRVSRADLSVLKPPVLWAYLLYIGGQLEGLGKLVRMMDMVALLESEDQKPLGTAPKPFKEWEDLVGYLYSRHGVKPGPRNLRQELLLRQRALLPESPRPWKSALQLGTLRLMDWMGWKNAVRRRLRFRST